MKGYSDFSPDICALREGNLRWSIDLPQRTQNRKIRINDVEGDVVLKWRAEVHRLTFFGGGGILLLIGGVCFQVMNQMPNSRV